MLEKQNVLNWLSLRRDNELNSFLLFPSIDLNLVAKCVSDLEYCEDFVMNRYTSICNQKNLFAFKHFVERLRTEFDCAYQK